MKTSPAQNSSSIRRNARSLALARQAVLRAVPSVQILSTADVIGAQVRAHRKKQGLRIDDAAALNGVSVDLMSRLENSSGSVRLDKLMRVLDGLGLTLLVAPKDHVFLQQLPTDRVLQPDGAPDHHDTTVRGSIAELGSTQ